MARGRTGTAAFVAPGDAALLLGDAAATLVARGPRAAFCGTARDLRARAEALAADGVTDLALQPGGDVPAELRRLAGALMG